MRTTLTLDDDLLEAAKALAQARGVSLGKALGDLAWRGLEAAPSRRGSSGFRTFAPPAGARRFGLEDVAAAGEAADRRLRSQFVRRGARRG
jgi:hypothetical protein